MYFTNTYQSVSLRMDRKYDIMCFWVFWVLHGALETILKMGIFSINIISFSVIERKSISLILLFRFNIADHFSMFTNVHEVAWPQWLCWSGCWVPWSPCHLYLRANFFMATLNAKISSVGATWRLNWWQQQESVLLSGSSKTKRFIHVTALDSQLTMFSRLTAQGFLHKILWCTTMRKRCKTQLELLVIYTLFQWLLLSLLTLVEF